MTTQEIADRLVELCRTGQYEAAQKELFADNAISMEPKGAPNELTEGLDAIIKKGIEFENMLERIHGGEVSDALVAGNHFSCRMTLDADFKGMGRVNMEEIAVFEVKDGKIISEQFFFTK